MIRHLKWERFDLPQDERDREIIDRIVKEKGVEAIPSLIGTLEKNEEDSDLMTLVGNAVIALGEESAPFLRSHLKEEARAFETNPPVYKEKAFRTTLLLVIDLLGEFGNRDDILLLEKFIPLYNKEKAQLIIYEAVSKLGGGEKYIDLLELYAFEDDFKEEMIGQVIMTLAFIDSPRALFDIVKITKFDWLPATEKEIAYKALKDQLRRNPGYYELLENDPYGSRLLGEITGEEA